MLIDDSYGKSAIRLVTVRRRPDAHDLKDVTIAIRLEGDFATAYTEGDNSRVLPTDTMKNTVYAFAADHPLEEIERFGLALAEHFIGTAHVTAVRIELVEQPWERLSGQAFRRAGGEMKTARIEQNQDGARVCAGLEDLVIMKTAKSAFEGFPRDRYTTLAETSDRILATSVSATWRYAQTNLPFGARWTEVRRRLLEAFVEHDSRSVQHTLYAMGEAALETPDVEEIHLVMPNIHHIPVDLTRFGLENRNEVFVATPEPYGLIEATLSRAGS